jgi:hypothetical protein
MGMTQGTIGGVLRGVQVAELEGHVSRSAVYLIHKEVRTGAGWKLSGFRQASIAKKRMLSHAECERPVTRSTIGVKSLPRWSEDRPQSPDRSDLWQAGGDKPGLAESNMVDPSYAQTCLQDRH